MRRENSDFNAAFVSYEGSKLYNNDYYGCAALNEFACYVVADGVSIGDVESESAKIAVQAAIAEFCERPSMKKGALRRYVLAAHKVLKEASGSRRLQASITVVVTDYQKIRYAWAGNSHFYLYRSGRLLNQSHDHSLSVQMVRRGHLSADKIAEHEERNNLARYVGPRESLRPQVSKKIKLSNGDVFTLLTSGVWERCDVGDILAVLESAENDPQLVIEDLERLMLDPYPNVIDDYTAAVVLVDKIYIDTNKGKRLKKTLLIGIPLLVILMVVAIILLVIRHNNETQRRNMNTAFDNAVVYIENDNHVRALEELTTSIGFAEELRDDEFRERATAWRAVLDAIGSGDRHFEAGDFAEAQNVFRTALHLSRYADNAGREYIERRMTAAEQFVTVRGLIALGDTLVSIGDLYAAEIRYQDAWHMAANIGDIDGREMAISALQNLYSVLDWEGTQQARENERRMLEDELVADATAREQESLAREAARRTEHLQEAVEMEATGDRAVAMRDYVNAELFYTIARERFASLGDTEAVHRIEAKQRSISDTIMQVESQRVIAELYIEEGDRLFDTGNFAEARARFILARNIYTRLSDDIAVASVLARITASDTQIARVQAEAGADARQQEQERQREQERRREQEQERQALEQTEHIPDSEDVNATAEPTELERSAEQNATDNASIMQGVTPAESTSDHAAERRELIEIRGNVPSENIITPSVPERGTVPDVNIATEPPFAEDLESHTAERRELTERRERIPE